MQKLLLALGVAALLAGTVYLMNEPSVPKVASSDAIEPQVYDLYGDWKKKYGKKYSSADQDWYRLTVFNDNYNYIKAFYEGPERSYQLDFNQFMDITSAEFVEIYL